MSGLKNVSPSTALGGMFGFMLVMLLVLPLFSLVLSPSAEDFLAGFSHRLFVPALWLSFRTTLVSLVLTVVLGTPLAWWLATSSSRLSRVVDTLVDLPIVIPPAVIGVALLQTFGRQGLVGPVFDVFSVHVPFTPVAVVLAQLVVSSPFYIQAAANAFRKVEPKAMVVARTLGASRRAAFFRIAIPIAAPGLVTGVSLAWARALGEFGATLIFAGNMSGTTQTMPLAIFSALESDVQLAVVFSLCLAGLGGVLLIGVRFVRDHSMREGHE